MEHKFIHVNGIKLHYVCEGEGKKLVVLLHGWPEFWYSWKAQIPALSENFTVVALDMRGFNESDKPEGIENYQAHLVAADVAELVKKLGFQKAHIVGHDWGGAIAWAFSMNYPELTDQLAILNCPHPSIFLQTLKKNPSQVLKSWYMFFFQIPKVPEMLLRPLLTQFFSTFIKGWCYNKDAFSKEDLEKYVAAYSKPGALTSSISYYRAMFQFGAKNKSIMKKRVQAPTLLIWAENDQALSKEMTFNTSKYIDNTFEVKYIPNCSHWVQNDAPEKVNIYLKTFLIP